MLPCKYGEIVQGMASTKLFSPVITRFVIKSLCLDSTYGGSRPVQKLLLEYSFIFCCSSLSQTQYKLASEQIWRGEGTMQESREMDASKADA